MSENFAHAPYNFVPFPERIIYRYDDYDDLPSHNANKEKDKDLLSGEVTFDIVAQSPILVADGTDLADEDKKKRNEPRTFVKDANGKYVIPGSTLRGLMRSTMSVLSMSNWTSRIDDTRFFYRSVAGNNPTLRKEYGQVLGGVPSIRKVKAGYLCKDRRGGYIIFPPQPIPGLNNTYFKVYTDDIADLENKEKISADLNDGFIIKDVRFSVGVRGRVQELYSCHAKNKGKLIFSGPIQGKKVAYVIMPPSPQVANMVVLNDEDLKTYWQDYDYRKGKFDQTDSEKYNRMTKFFGEFPNSTKPSEGKPCFYVEHNGKVYIGFTPHIRIPYDNTIKDLIPRRIGTQNEKSIDYTESLLGFTNKNKKSYASRLNFSPSLIKGNVKPLRGKDFVLSSPEASASELYLKQDMDDEAYKTYNQKDSELRGMKQYWIKDMKDVRVHSNADEEENKNIQSTLCPLPKGTIFKAKIKFDQLHKDELGLLLFALRKPTFHQIGMGKPFGYGTVKFNNISCRKVNKKNIYNNFSSDFNLNLKEINIDEMVNAYLKRLSTKERIDILKQESVRTFLNMKEKAKLKPKEMSYMTTEEYGENKKLPTAKQLFSRYLK